MKKIIPFTKDIRFNTKIYEITSISLEHNLSMIENDYITGEFVVSGDYKINDSSINTEPFIHGLPFDITLDTKYNPDKFKIDIDDFKFEIVNEEILRVNIDVLIEGIELIETEDEIPIIDEIKPDLIIEARNEEDLDEEIFEKDRFNILENLFEEKDDEKMNTADDLFMQVDENIQKVIKTDDVTSIFNNFNDKDEKYVSYYVHIVRENDNIDSISLKYNVSIDELKEYNNIDKITLGDKIIVPYTNNEAI